MFLSCNNKEIENLKTQIDSLSTSNKEVNVKLDSAEAELDRYKTSVESLCVNIKDLFENEDDVKLEEIQNQLEKYHPEAKEIETVKGYIKQIKDNRTKRLEAQRAKEEAERKAAEAREEAERKAAEAKERANRVGKWHCKQFAGYDNYLNYDVEITKDDEGYVAKVSGDWSDHIRLNRKGNKYYWQNGPAGDYYLVNGRTMKVCDQDGVINEVSTSWIN